MPTMERYDNGYLQAPAGALFEMPEHIRHTRIRLADEITVNTCNIAVGDADGSGIDRIAIPFNIGERDLARLYDGAGGMIWENDKIRFYHAYYNDPRKINHDLLVLYYKHPHRHLLTEIVDVDDDGRNEVVVGDGPLYILDGRTGAIKQVIELDGLCPQWNVVFDPRRGRHIIVVAVTRPPECSTPSKIVAVTAAGGVLWKLDTPGGQFQDCMHHGDINADGRPEIGFSMSHNVQEFWVIDCDGRLLWKKHVPSELGKDSHVDAFVIDRVAPAAADVKGNQVALVCGPNILDGEGRVIWRKEEDGRNYHHMQNIIVADFFPEKPGKEVYASESYRRRSHLFDCNGGLLWTYDNYTRKSDGERAGRLSTAVCLADWTGRGAREIVQTEMGPWSETDPNLRMSFIHVLDARTGTAIEIFPIDYIPMCAIAGRLTGSAANDVVTVGHLDSAIHVYTRLKTGNER